MTTNGRGNLPLWMAVADGRTAGGQLTRKISINQKAINWQHLVLLVVVYR